MGSPRLMLLSLALASRLTAANLPDLGGPIVSTLGNSSDSTSTSFQTIILNTGLAMAQNDPKYAEILSALGIINAQDLQNFIKGDLNRNNFKDIVIHAAFQHAQNNPLQAEWFAAAGITDEPSLREFLEGATLEQKRLIFSLALQHAMTNPTYASWLDALEIEDVSDISEILNDGLEATNFKDILMSSGIAYLQTQSKFQKYAFILSLLLGDDTLNTSEKSELYLGAYDGLPISEVKTIQLLKNKKGTGQDVTKRRK